MRNRALGLSIVFVIFAPLLFGSIPAEAGYWYWRPINTVDIVPGMYNNDLKLDETGDILIRGVASNPNNIEMEIKTDKVWENGYVQFSYDTGKDDLGGSNPTYNRKHRAVITWVFSGFYDDNNDVDTFIRFIYTLYYMQGSTKYVVGQNEIKINDNNHDYNNYVINHFVESDGNVPSGKILYVLIEFRLSADASWREVRIEHDFWQGSNHIVLDKVVFEEYRYDPGTPPILP